MNSYELTGTYGSGKIPCNIFVVEGNDGGKWYCVEGSKNCNLTYDDMNDGVNVEELSDEDAFTTMQQIDTLEELEDQVIELYN